MNECGLSKQEFELVQAAADVAALQWDSTTPPHPSSSSSSSSARKDTSSTGSSAGSSQLQELGRQLLQCAADGQAEQLERLMARGAPLTSDWLGTSPLHMAAMYGHLNVAKFLLSTGVVRDVRTKVDKTPLHFAATEGFLDIARLLLEHGAAVDLRDMLNMTALHWAVQRAHTECVELLLKYGANVQISNKFDKTPLDIAVDIANTNIQHMLNNCELYRAAVQANNNTEAELKPAVDSIIDDMARDDAVTAESLQQAPHSTPGHVTPTSSTEDRDIGSSQPGLDVLASHGITMMPLDDVSGLPHALTSGRRVSLTAAGALAMGQTRPSLSSPTSPANPARISTTSSSGTSVTGVKKVTVSAAAGRKVTKVIRLTSHQLAKLTQKPGSPAVRLSSSSGNSGGSTTSGDNRSASVTVVASATPSCGASQASNTGSVPPALKRLKFVPYQNGEALSCPTLNTLESPSVAADLPVFEEVPAADGGDNSADGCDEAESWDHATLTRQLHRVEQLAASHQQLVNNYTARAAQYRQLLARNSH